MINAQHCSGYYMLRGFVALLLVFSWIILSGYDVVEDLVLPDQIEFQSSIPGPAAPHGSSGLVTRNIVESADHTPYRCQCLLEQFATQQASYPPHYSHKTSKLHKVHRVFLI
jgi:hypothetical protein